MGQERPEFDIIQDYATRGKALPTIGLTFTIQQDGKLKIYAENPRLAAAAQLRSEPVGVDLFKIYK